MAKKSTSEIPVLGPEFARMFNIPPAQVYRAAKAGFFSSCSYVDEKTGKVWLYPKAAKAHWDTTRDHNKAANLTKSAAAANGKPKRERREYAKPPAAATGGSPDSAIVESVAELKRKGLQLKLQSDALDLQRKRGALVDKSKVYSALFEVGKEIRLAFLSIPDRVVDAMLSAGSRTEAHAILSKEIHDHLQRIADRISGDVIKI
jgi:hypothetical protein